MSKARQRAKDLVKLAVHGDNPGKEELAAAYRVCKLIDKYDLLSSPLDGLLDKDDETVVAARDIFETLTNPNLVKSVKKMAGVLSGARHRKRR